MQMIVGSVFSLPACRGLGWVKKETKTDKQKLKSERGAKHHHSCKFV